MRVKPNSDPPVELMLCNSIKVRLGLLDNLMMKFTNKDSMITSGSELSAPHMKGSKHFTGEAIDVRNWGVVALKQTGRMAFFSGLLEVFDEHRFDIVEHTTHIHIEFDPVSNLSMTAVRMKVVNRKGKKVYGEFQPMLELPQLRFESKFRKVLNTSYKVVKTTTNIVSRRYAGVEIFKKGKKKSLLDKLMEIFNTILTKLKGK